MAIISFISDYPNAIIVPADSSNIYWPAGHNGVPNKPKVLVLHTPEEDADNIEVTPRYFQTPDLAASTHYYHDSDGDVYAMVPEECAAIANGVVGKPYPPDTDPNHSLNWQSLSTEIEGRAATIHTTLLRGGAQFNSLVNWCINRAAKYGIRPDRAHIIGHYQVSNQRSDPGALFPWTALIEDVNKGLEDVRVIHSIKADRGIWTNPPVRINTKQTQRINARYDFYLPADAKRIELEILLFKGYVEIFNGNATVAGRCGWGIAVGSPSYMTCTVELDKEGWFTIVNNSHVANPAEFAELRTVAYWR